MPTALQLGAILVSGLTPLGPNPESPWAKVMNSFQVADDVIHSRGNHTWRFGMLVERLQWNTFDSQFQAGQWRFSSLDSFLLGGPQGTDLRVALPGFSDSYRGFRQTLVGLYLQDDYKIRPSFTLNLGLRYEFTTRIHDLRGRATYLLDEFRDSEPRIGSLMQQNPSLRNVAPRVGLSWSLGSLGRTVIRAGAGIYHDQIIEYSVDNLRNTGPFYQLVALPNVDVSRAFPDAVAAAGDARAKQLRIFEYSNPKTPTVYRYHFSLEQEIVPGLTVEATYLGARGNHLLRTAEVNQFPLPVPQHDGSLLFPADPDPHPVLGPDNTVNSAFSGVQKIFTDAQSFYNALTISISQRFWRGLTLDGNYTFSKSVDDASTVSTLTGGTAPPIYGLDRTLNRGLSSFDIRHRFSMRYFYNLPLGTGQKWLGSGWLSQVLGGWRLGGLLTARSGSAGNVQYGIPAPGFLFTSERPNLKLGRGRDLTRGVTAGCSGLEAGRPVGDPDLYYDPCAFEPPLPGYIGNAGRGILIGPHIVSLDLSIQKEFALDTRRRLQFRAEMFNLPNHSNFRGPETSGTSVFRSADGRLNPSAGRLRSTATTSRQIQFALRLSF